MTEIRTSLGLLALAALASVLGGCVVGQSVEMTPSAAKQSSLPADVFNLQVSDDRPYVVSGDKAPHYIGKYRAGFGIPYDVSTEANVPLKDLIRNDLGKRLTRFGDNARGAQVTVSIREWKFDVYQNGKFTYDLQIGATGPGQSAPKTEVLSETVRIDGTFWTGGKGGIERDMPGIFDRVMTRVVAPGSVVHTTLMTSR